MKAFVLAALAALIAAASATSYEWRWNTLWYVSATYLLCLMGGKSRPKTRLTVAGID
jgi:hypothetical protein